VSSKEKHLKNYDVKMEVTLPATIVYRVLAESPEEALELVKKANPLSVKYLLKKKRDLKALVYDAGTTLVRFTKTYLR
jgi:hypothetical protein